MTVYDEKKIGIADFMNSRGKQNSVINQYCKSNKFLKHKSNFNNNC